MKFQLYLFNFFSKLVINFFNIFLKKLTKEITKKKGFNYSLTIPRTTYSPWLDNLEFKNFYDQIKKNTLIDIYRLYELSSLVKQAELIDGDILEIGVWRGGSSAVLRKYSDPGKNLYLVDTFSGVVNASSEDSTYIGEEHKDTGVELVRRFLDKLSLYSNVVLIRAKFPDDFKMNLNKISFVHIDVDTYFSAKQSFEYIEQYLSVGSIVVFDDYAGHTTDGVTSYCNEVKSSSKYTFIHNLNGHAIFIKR